MAYGAIFIVKTEGRLCKPILDRDLIVTTGSHDPWRKRSRPICFIRVRSVELC